jgi:hypothetical protein
MARLVTLSAAVTLFGAPALAQDGKPAPIAHCPPSPEPSLQGQERAEALSRRFECLFAAGEYQGCLPVLDEACRLTDAPRCLFNLALVHQALFHCELAASYYEAYLSRDPYDAPRDEAVAALNELRRICGQPEQEPTPPPPAENAIQPLDERALVVAPEPPAAIVPAPPSPVVPRESPGRVRKVLAFSTLGAGVATTIATAVFAGYGRRAQSDVVARTNDNGRVRDAEVSALDDNGRRYNTFAWVFLGSSVALLGTSVTLFVLDAQAEHSLDVAAEGALSVRYWGRF